MWLIVAGKVMVFASFRAAACHFLAKSILGFPRIGGRDSVFSCDRERGRTVLAKPDGTIIFERDSNPQGADKALEEDEEIIL